MPCCLEYSKEYITRLNNTQDKISFADRITLSSSLKAMGGEKRVISLRNLPKKRPAKTSYFFNPKNTLTGSSTHLPSVSTSKISATTSANFPIPTSSTSIHKPATSVNNAASASSKKRLEGLIPESSDDSFEGVRWKASPPKQGALPIPSSPLARPSLLLSSPERLDSRAALINEHAASLLSKYGALPGPATSPRLSPLRPLLPRSVSDKSQLMPEPIRRSPQLLRSRTDGPEVAGGKLSTLNTWISIFETGSESPKLNPVSCDRVADRIPNQGHDGSPYDQTHHTRSSTNPSGRESYSAESSCAPHSHRSTGSHNLNNSSSLSNDHVSPHAISSGNKIPGAAPDTQRRSTHAGSSQKHTSLSHPTTSTRASSPHNTNSRSPAGLEGISFGDFSLLSPAADNQKAADSDLLDPFSSDDELLNAIPTSMKAPQNCSPNSNSQLHSKPALSNNCLRPSLDPKSVSSNNPHCPSLHFNLNPAKSLPGSDLSDAFSDDDSELLRVAALHSQKASPASLNPPALLPAVPTEFALHPLSSQSATQLARDTVHAKSFQKSILEFDSRPSSGYRYTFDPPSISLSFSRPYLRRYQIKSVRHAQFGASQRQDQLIVLVCDAENALLVILVRGEYMELDLAPDDIVHVIITHPENPNLIDNTRNLLIWNPDTLVSATTVAQQLTCPRKTVLLRAFKFPGTTTIPILAGEIIHLIFQTCLTLEHCLKQLMEQALKSCLERFRPDIYSLGPMEDVVRAEVEKQLPYLETWFKTYFKRYLTKANAIPTSTHQTRVMFLVSKIIDIEEDIWLPVYGLRGKVDASVEAKLLNTTNRGAYLLPMEIKTGMEYVSHAAQASLYSLLFKDRYDAQVASYIMVYTKSAETKKGDISPQDLKSLVNLRNRLTKWLKAGNRAYPPLLRLSTCDRCDVRLACMVVNRLAEGGTVETCGIPSDDYEPMVAQLDGAPHYSDFFNHWDSLLVQEELIMKKSFKYLWTLTSRAREKHDGSCLGRLALQSCNDVLPLQQSFLYTFVLTNTLMQNFFETQVCLHDRVVISDEMGNSALGFGIVSTLSKLAISITSTKRLSTTTKLPQWAPDNQVYSSALEPAHAAPKGTLYRIDKDSIYSGLALARYNVLNLFLAEGDWRRRKLLVDKQAPTFTNVFKPPAFSAHLNTDQIKAIEKVLLCDHYALIQGMPGTGKTTVIAEIIRLLVALGKTVLLASYTHSAVDNILLKVKEHNVSFLRLGLAVRVHRDIRPYVTENQKYESYHDFTNMYTKPRVVATTCLGISDFAFEIRQQFDYCIIDEASQVLMPNSLGPLRFCDKFVLVGDHLQLLPLVQHPHALVKHGLSQSLFKIFCDMHPHSVARLTYQYRMCREIMQLANVLVYQNQLQCGSSEVANRQFEIPHPERLMQFQSGPKSGWLETVIDPKRRVLFLDTDIMQAPERRLGDKVENIGEAELLRQMVAAFLACGVHETQIGVMTFNKAQYNRLSRVLASWPDVEVLTADRYQGRDKECILVSLVRSNAEHNAGDLVREWRRVNVAITRAKAKLVLVGSALTLSSAPTILLFLGLLQERGWVQQLGADAAEQYKFRDANSAYHKIRVPENGLVSKHAVLRDIVRDAH